ncbi:TetR/AcrR family transcriptional regulator [Rhodopseudomonas palustris]|uniref:Possible transcriptional regulator, TetR family n=1 Tax=Rhodopseudomonas palustris (strain ATCC BAA-98 / CGA009) TaxID=258594 RepID=Q6NB92_RHOPA|nr:TetR/AcrR family transcriptional regulator [Rhodopseudomonas palustris]OPF91769.1 TetR family transcriptional regulator [Rhodopseudomonas palustris]PPQ44645.1 TetR family transcriptional regulator [Rhodopseudomonas palustris]RJF60070.1 TetR/AcrR family transcriptional regulator [Rhodopseudomonas palustris]WAB78621.1 TetR/AcrR family transcriptional regulator [Rhodopseudomonas palustris]WCL91069.1 TetR/AcrR family transcriptional regulator [Rhodopseudomonas palustris CGA009]
MQRNSPKSRPGGRAARTKTATFQAVAELVAEKGHGAVSMTDVAERAGVAATSLYRRWGDIGSLIREVAVEQLMRDYPIPDTGSIEGDLRQWARSIALTLSRPEGSSFFRAFVATATPTHAGTVAPPEALARRIEQIEQMLARANARGERALAVDDVIDFLLAPLFVRALFGTPLDEEAAEALAERLLKRC